MRSLILPALAAAAALAAPVFAAAQPVPVECQQRVNNNRLVGGLLGAGIGAVAGRGVASRGTRTEGGVLGAVVGAVAGSEIARRRIACDDPAYSGVYRDNRYRPSQYGYPQGHSHSHSAPQRVVYAPPPVQREECGWGEASVRRPDGLIERQQVWMCRDHRGAWVAAN
jgi:Glycine zipper 2TM domain